jgi:AcrR family transcriptional regulator
VTPRTCRKGVADSARDRRRGAQVPEGASSRRVPRQERSATTVEAILEAAGELITARGFRALTTKAVARRAGVSIGSLYQYFPNKAAILGRLIEQHVAEVEPAVERSLQELADPAVPYSDALRRLFMRLIELHRAHPHLHDLLLGDASQDALRLRRERERDYVAQTAAILRNRHDVSVANLLLAAQVTVLTAEALSHWLVHSAPPDLDREAFVEEAVRLLSTYAGAAT